MIEKIRSIKDKFRYDESERPFLDHLDELRKTVIRSIIALFLGSAICLPFADRLIAYLRRPAEAYIQHGQIRLQFAEPAAAVKMWLSVAFFGGLFLSLPALIFFISSFVMPGLRDKERKVLVRIALFSGVLFLIGVVMGYQITLPLALGWMVNLGARLGGESIWFYNKYIAFSIHLLLGFGLAFQLPVVILILGKMGLVNSQQLREKRRHMIIIILILAMFLTPPDVATQLLMALPLILLYESCIWFLHFGGNRTQAPATPDSEKEVEKLNEE